MEFTHLKNLDDWNQYKSSKNNKETIVFKFSPACPVSFIAEKKFDSWLKNLDNDLNINIFKVDVINSRSLSQTIAYEFDIKHESPQIIWLDKKGNIKWNASHYSITKGALDEKLTGKKVSFLRKIF